MSFLCNNYSTLFQKTPILLKSEQRHYHFITTYVIVNYIFLTSSRSVLNLGSDVSIILGETQ